MQSSYSGQKPTVQMSTWKQMHIQIYSTCKVFEINVLDLFHVSYFGIWSHWKEIDPNPLPRKKQNEYKSSIARQTTDWEIFANPESCLTYLMTDKNIFGYYAKYATKTKKSEPGENTTVPRNICSAALSLSFLQESRWFH